MAIPVIAIRPQPGCDATVAEARGIGLAAHGFPLFRIAPVAWRAPDPTEVDALLIGSANALRHAGPALAAFAGKPAYAVGETTARAARGAGLAVVATGSGGLQPVLDTIAPPHVRLLRLAGRERIVLTPPPGIVLVERVVYASAAIAMPAPLASLLRAPAVVLLHSAEAARHFAAECDRLGLSRGHLSLAAIGPRVAAAAGDGWRALRSADTAQDSAMLALARRMCQEAGSLS